MGATPQEVRRWRPILTAQIGQESNFTQGVGSPAGARDIAQFMPGTAPGYGVKLGDGRIKDDIRGQVRYMLPLLRKYGAEGALRGYNAGVGAIERSHGFSETNNYVKQVLGTAGKYGGVVQPAGGGRPGSPQIQLPPGADLSGLLAALGQQKPPAPVGGMSTTPGFSARNALALPGMYSGIETGQAPGPKPGDLKDLLSQISTPFELASVTGGSQQQGGLYPSGVAPGKVVLGPGADRPGTPTSKRVLNFVGQVAGVAGVDALTIGTGTNHSKMTVSGNVSNHWTGHGADVPSSGAELLRLGRAALVAAGMNPKKARKAKGGRYEVGGWQIIFSTNTPDVGDHTDHLHVGWRG
jgi:hypothetical protein